MKKFGKILFMISPVLGANGFYPATECKKPDENKSACQGCRVNDEVKLKEPNLSKNAPLVRVLFRSCSGFVRVLFGFYWSQPEQDPKERRRRIGREDSDHHSFSLLLVACLRSAGQSLWQRTAGRQRMQGIRSCLFSLNFRAFVANKIQTDLLALKKTEAFFL